MTDTMHPHPGHIQPCMANVASQRSHILAFVPLTIFINVFEQVAVFLTLGRYL